MSKNLRFACLLSILLPATPLLPAQSSGVIKISDATAIRLSLSEALSSATNQVDDPVRFEVTEDVKVGDFVAISKGSTAVGHVVEVESRKRMGRAGKLNFSIDHVKAADGSNVRLRASTTRKGDDKSGTVIVGTLMLSPLFLIMRGKDVDIPRGTSLAAYVDGDREINGSPRSNGSAFGAGTAEANPAASAKTMELATVVVKSDPDGADVSVDGKFVGNAPSTMQLTPGDHIVIIERAGFRQWRRSITLTPGGIVSLNGTLERN